MLRILKTEMKINEKNKFARIDTPIKHHLRKQGLTLNLNTYAGFDTEFTNETTKRINLFRVN